MALFEELRTQKSFSDFAAKPVGKDFLTPLFLRLIGRKKRRINFPLLNLLASGVYQRRAAILLRVHRQTVERKFPLLAWRARTQNDKHLSKFKGRIINIQIDDLITKENSKLKPLSVSIAVDEDRRLILGAEVSKIPAFGHLSRLAIKKYGYREDEHFAGLTRLFQRITPLVSTEVLIIPDKHQRYPGFISAYLPKTKHL
jgi:hypothetical protein